ncbi:MAG: response regulator [Chloroflexi bacterium]|nr:response regulator [Chloroflexota bacterium]
MPNKILIVDPDASTTAWLTTRLARAGYTTETVTSAAESLAAIVRAMPDVIILERDLPDQNGLALIPQMRAIIPDVGIFVLSARGGTEEILAGLSAGANDYIVKQPGADVELVTKLRNYAAQPKTKPAPAPVTTGAGKIFAFISAKGGSGTTSICINTASALAKLEPHAEIVVVDMVFPIGSIAASVGFETRETIAKMTRTEKRLIDRAVVEKYISGSKRWGFHVMIGASNPHEAASLEVSQIVPLFETLQHAYDYVFVDFGRALSRISIPIIEVADNVVIILTPDSNTVRMTRLILEYFGTLGVSSERLILLNNRTVGRVWVSKEESEKQLGLPLAATIPFEQEYFTLAMNSGVPFINKFPDLAASLMFNDVARLLKERSTR